MKTNRARLYWSAIAPLLLSSAAVADDLHPLMSSKYWSNVGVFFSARNFDASASGAVAGTARSVDFDSSAGVDDRPDLFLVEFGWQFSRKWGLALQYFQSERDASKVLSESIAWRDLVFNVGVRIDAETSVKVTRLFFSRQFRDNGPHSLRLGAGLHWLELGAGIAGEATLNDLSREFRRSVVSADVPVPNIGAWYRFSPSRRWMFTARADWLSASIDDFSGGIWNAAVGVNFSPWQHFGFGLNYQFFQLDGTLKESLWRGDIRTRLNGPVVYVSGYW